MRAHNVRPYAGEMRRIEFCLSYHRALKKNDNCDTISGPIYKMFLPKSNSSVTLLPELLRMVASPRAHRAGAAGTP